MNSTGTNFAPEVNRQLVASVSALEKDSSYFWKIWKNGEDDYNIFWSDEDVASKEKGDIVEVSRLNTKDEENIQEGTVQVSTQRQDAGVTINTIAGGTFEEKAAEDPEPTAEEE